MGDTIDSSQSGGDAAIVRIHGTNKALAICSDCNPHYVAADPFEGGKQAVAEAYRNLSAVGATPIAITDNLNFGNPEKPDTMGVIVKAIEGMAEACKVLEFPVVSGNVSLYNETDGVGIPPTPVVGGIGLIENLDHVATLKGAQEGDVLLLIGDTDDELGASAYARVILGLDGRAAGNAPRVDLQLEADNAAFVRKLIADGLVHAVHDLSEGGLACAAADMALAANQHMRLMAQGDSPVVDLFSETQSRYLIALSADQMDTVWERMQQEGIPGGHIGDCLPAEFAEGPGLFITFDDMERGRYISLATLRAAHEGWLPNYMKGQG